MDYLTRNKNVTIIIVDDSNGKVKLPGHWDVYGYDRQEEELGTEMYKRFEVFHKSSSCRNFGHWIAYKKGFDIIMGVDSDCVVPPSFVSDHLTALLAKSATWTNPIANTGLFSRGFPYSARSVRTVLSLGLWNNELDLYGKDRVDFKGELPKDPLPRSAHETADGFIPLSGMNWAMWADAMPSFLFLPNFEYGEIGIDADANNPQLNVVAKTYKFRRHDDIWGGYIFQKIMASMEERIKFGLPVVKHDTVVVPEEDAAEEEGMIAFENSFLGTVDAIFNQIHDGDYEDLMWDFSRIITEEWKNSEWAPLIDPINLWVEMFESVEVTS